jgi:hypothetical protein
MSSLTTGGLLSIFRKNVVTPGHIPPPRTVVPATVLPAPTSSIPAPIRAANVEAARLPRLVFAFDATASRQEAWASSKQLQDNLLRALPGELEVALAVHAGGRIKTFTRFTSNSAELRSMAAGVRCKAGFTKLLPILARVLKLSDVRVVVYISDAFEESEREARRIADALCANRTRVIILHDGKAHPAFGEITARTGGALLPFDISALDALLQAVAVLAVGDVELLETKQATMPAATLLLEHLGDRKRLTGTK